MSRPQDIGTILVYRTSRFSGLGRARCRWSYHRREYGSLGHAYNGLRCKYGTLIVDISEGGIERGAGNHGGRLRVG